MTFGDLYESVEVNDIRVVDGEKSYYARVTNPEFDYDAIVGREIERIYYDSLNVNLVAELKYKPEIEQLNYYAWAKFLEKVNSDDALNRVLGKLELSTPRRSDLSVYRKILELEFEGNSCFYCGKKIKTSAHVDHVIPWSFVKSDHLWNFVIACPACNSEKKDRVPSKENLSRIWNRFFKIR